MNSSDPTQAKGYRVAPSTPSGGYCNPNAPSKLPVGQVVICRLEHPLAVDCPDGEICVPEGNADTGDVCVLLDGSVTCPGDFSQATTLNETVNDARICSCSCGSPTGTCSGAHIDLYDHWNCTGGLQATAQANGNCADVSGVTGHDGYEVEAGTFNSTGCTPSDNHSGTVTFGGVHTLCCP